MTGSLYWMAHLPCKVLFTHFVQINFIFKFLKNRKYLLVLESKLVFCFVCSFFLRFYNLLYDP